MTSKGPYREPDTFSLLSDIDKTTRITLAKVNRLWIKDSILKFFIPTLGAIALVASIIGLGVIVRGCRAGDIRACGTECSELSAETGKKYKIITLHGGRSGCWCYRRGKYIQSGNF